MIAGVYERHAHHCRSARSTAHSRDPRSCRRDGAIRRWLRLRAPLHWRRNEPMPAPGCRWDRDRYPSVCACTIRTTQRAVRRGNTRENSDDDDGALWLPRLRHKRKAMPLQRRCYAYCLPSCCFREMIADAIRSAAREDTQCPAASKLRNSFRFRSLSRKAWPKCGSIPDESGAA
jgi:hypothetical protein